MADEVLKIIFDGTTDKLKDAAKDAELQIGEVESVSKKLSGFLSSGFKDAAVVGASALTGLGGEAFLAVKSFNEHQAALNQLDAVLKSTGDLTGKETATVVTSTNAHQLSAIQRQKLNDQLKIEEAHLSSLTAKQNAHTKSTKDESAQIDLANVKIAELKSKLNQVTTSHIQLSSQMLLTRKDIIDEAEALAAFTPNSRDAVLGVENIMLTFRDVKNQIYQESIPAILDMSQAMHTDLKDTAIQVGKALQDPSIGLTALRRVGIDFSKSQSDVIKNLESTGKMAEAQQMILTELQKEFGGSAKAAGQTFGGQLTILKNDIDDVQASIGQFISRALQPLMVNFITPLVGHVKDFADELSQTGNLTQSLTDNFGTFGQKIGDMIMFFENNRLALMALIGVIATPFVAALIAAGAVAVSFIAPFLGVAALMGGIAVGVGLLIRQLGGFGKAWQDLKNLWDLIHQAYMTQLKPSLDDIWKTMTRQLMPAFEDFWKKYGPGVLEILKLLAITVGVLLIEAIKLYLKYTDLMIHALLNIYNAVDNFKTAAGSAFKKIGDDVDWLKGHWVEALAFVIAFIATLPAKMIAYSLEGMVGIGKTLVSNIPQILSAWGQVLAALGKQWMDSFTKMVNFILHIDWKKVGDAISSGFGQVFKGSIEGIVAGVPGGSDVLKAMSNMHIPGFASGGVVPGLPGAPMLAVVHGGEKITPAGGQNSSQTINFDLSGASFGSKSDIDYMLNEVRKMMGRQGELAQLGVI